MTDPMQTEREADLPICPECNGSGKDGTPEGFACFPCNGTGKNLGVDHAPVAWAVFVPNGNIRMWSADSEYVREFAERHGVPMTPLYRKASAVLAASELRSLRDALALAKSGIAELEGTSRERFPVTRPCYYCNKRVAGPCGSDQEAESCAEPEPLAFAFTKAGFDDLCKRLIEEGRQQARAALNKEQP